jgi:hypothetical protein
MTAGEGPDDVAAGLDLDEETGFEFFAIAADMGPISLSENKKAALGRGADGGIYKRSVIAAAQRGARRHVVDCWSEWSWSGFMGCAR